MLKIAPLLLSWMVLLCNESEDYRLKDFLRTEGDDDTWKSTLPLVEHDEGQREEDKLPRACTLLHQIVIEKYFIPIRSNNSV